MEKVAAQPVEYALRFSSPGHLANKDFHWFPKIYDSTFEDGE